MPESRSFSVPKRIVRSVKDIATQARTAINKATLIILLLDKFQFALTAVKIQLFRQRKSGYMPSDTV